MSILLGAWMQMIFVHALIQYKIIKKQEEKNEQINYKLMDRNTVTHEEIL